MTTFDEAYEELRALHEAYDASDGSVEAWRALQLRSSALIGEGGQAGWAAARYVGHLSEEAQYRGCW